MWRYDARRSANSPCQLPDILYLNWKIQLEKPKPAWSKEQYKLQFDKSYEPVAAGKLLYIASMVNDSVKAYGTETGKMKWAFYCRGPVRFAPVWYKGRVYFTSDDGYLYCLDAETGTMVWEKKLAPADNMVYGNGRIISAWPARGGVVIEKDRLYCGAGVWPFMGVFICCIDPADGDIIWENSRSGSKYMTQQHSSNAFAGVAPQGYLAASNNKLLIPSRTIPACFDMTTGQMSYYNLSSRDYGKYVGGYNVTIWDKWFFNNGVLYTLDSGDGLAKTAGQVADTDGIIAFDSNGNLMAYAPKSTEKPTKNKSFQAKGLWKADFDQKFDRIHIKAGDKLYASKDSQGITAVKTPQDDKPASIVWKYEIKDKIWSMIVADNKLFAVTEEGALYCFGNKRRHVKIHRLRKKRDKVKQIKNRTSTESLMGCLDIEGNCVLLEMGNKQLLKEMLINSRLNIIAFEKNANKAAAARKEFDKLGFYGTRLSIIEGDIETVALPPYFADVIVSEQYVLGKCNDPERKIRRIYSLLRPYGGIAWLSSDNNQQLELYSKITGSGLWGNRIETDKMLMKLIRSTGPEGSSDWTHQYGNIANSLCSDDNLKLPLGILWFGEDSEFTDVLPRHAHGPSEQVVGGRLFIEGVDSMTARDVYTGKTLWKRQFKNMNNSGVYYDDSYIPDFLDLSYNQQHIPGANSRGTNFVATADNLYVLEDKCCRVVDCVTGKITDTFTLKDKAGSARQWGYLGAYKDLLIAGSDFVDFTGMVTSQNSKKIKWIDAVNKSASHEIVIMNRYTGHVLWTMRSDYGFIHNGIAVGNGKLFCLDRIPQAINEHISQDKNIKTYRLAAIDIETGNIIWEARDKVFGSWLGYSEKYDILLQADRKSRDMLSERGLRMNTFQGKSGVPLWDIAVDYSGPCIINDNMIITQHKSFDLMTGKQKMITHPLSGEEVPWNYSRNYGCGTVVSSRNILTFRSACAGFYDLQSDSGTGNFGGFRSGCTSNLIVANGVLNAPDYTRTCTCSYQNQTSLAMIHMPDVEIWTFNDLPPATERIRRLGINFGAPGNRKSETGTLWLDYPSNSGKSPDPVIKITGDNVKYFGKHSLRISKGDLKWVESYGAKGVDEITIKVLPGEIAKDPNSKFLYTVALHFIEPVAARQGERIFDILLQDNVVLKDFDIFRNTDGNDIGISKRFSGIDIPEELHIKLVPVKNSPIQETIICGVELILEK